VTRPIHRSLPLTRLIAILAIVVTMPFSAMASAFQPVVCDSRSVASAVILQSTGCCAEHHQPCGTQGKNCPGTGSGCAQGCGQVQTIDRARMLFAALELPRLYAIGPVTTLISAAGPDGQWRPPRAL
jgi:hypothetical protein